MLEASKEIINCLSLTRRTYVICKYKVGVHVLARREAGKGGKKQILVESLSFPISLLRRSHDDIL